MSRLRGHRKTGRETTKPLREKAPSSVPSMVSTEGLPPELLEALMSAFGGIAMPSPEDMEKDVDRVLVERLWRSHALNIDKAVKTVETIMCGPQDAIDDRTGRSQSFARVIAMHMMLLGASTDVPAAYTEFARVHALKLFTQYEKEKKEKTG